MALVEYEIDWNGEMVVFSQRNEPFATFPIMDVYMLIKGKAITVTQTNPSSGKLITLIIKHGLVCLYYEHKQYHSCELKPLAEFIESAYIQWALQQ